MAEDCIFNFGKIGPAETEVSSPGRTVSKSVKTSFVRSAQYNEALHSLKNHNELHNEITTCLVAILALIIQKCNASHLYKSLKKGQH